MIPLADVDMTEIEMQYVAQAARQRMISGTGEMVKVFERGMAQRIGRKHAIAVSNGTVALEIALAALGIGLGDEVLVPALTFVAPAAAVRRVGATPVLVDVHPIHWTIDPSQIESVISRATKAIIAVDILGHPCDYAALAEIAERYGLLIVEDAAEAHGACYENRYCGSFGILSTFSFHANKTITTGEGGMILTDEDSVAEHLRLLVNHGMSPSRPYWHPVVGTNARMHNLAAAVGVGQMERWDVIMARRDTIRQTYEDMIGSIPNMVLRPVSDFATEKIWLAAVYAQHRDRIVKRLRDAQIDARPIWTAISQLPPYADGRVFPVAERLAQRLFWLPTFNRLSEEQFDVICEQLFTIGGYNDRRALSSL